VKTLSRATVASVINVINRNADEQKM